MERDMSARRIYGEEESTEGAAGSEFGKKQREEARRKKFGIVTREFKVEDQPWILRVNGKAGKRWGEKHLFRLCVALIFINICLSAQREHISTVPIMKLKLASLRGIIHPNLLAGYFCTGLEGERSMFSNF